MGRIIKKIEKIDYSATEEFFNSRANRYNESHPYTVTMYHDNNPDLVNKRNEYEAKRLLPLLNIDNNSKVLDLACGVGRWYDIVGAKVASYTGIDFSCELIKIAQGRHSHDVNANFIIGPISDTGGLLKNNEKYSHVLLIGALVYLNDQDVYRTLKDIGSLLAEHATILIREPIAIKDRLTLKEFFSDELDASYNAIYRTKNELIEIFEKTIGEVGFKLVSSDFLFKDSSELNDRRETTQFYFLWKR